MPSTNRTPPITSGSNALPFNRRHRFSAVLGHHVEQVVDDLRSRALGTHLFFVRGVHVHRHGPKPLAPGRAQQLEERPDVLPTAPPTDPQHFLAIRLDDHRRVAMALLDGELIHRHDLGVRQVRWADPLGQVGPVDPPERLAVEPVVLGHMLDRQHLAEPRDALGQPPRAPRMAAQPGQLLQLRTAPRAEDATPMDQQVRLANRHNGQPRGTSAQSADVH